MNIYNISEKEFNNLKEYNLDKSIFSTEARMYILIKKNLWNKEKYLFKKLYNDTGMYFSNKLFTINEFINNKDSINMEELVVPDNLVSIDYRIVGFTVPFINGTNFQLVLDDKNISVSEKIDYLKEIGLILIKMDNIRNYKQIKDFYINDLHENNFILNSDTGKINVVDVDSFKINGNIAGQSRYLSSFCNISHFQKYKKIEKGYSVGGIYEISKNTDLYCYIIMILNYISNYKINRVSLEVFYDYLYFLHNIGISYELLDNILLIFSEKENVNIYEYLDELKYFVPKTNYSNLLKLTKK